MAMTTMMAIQQATHHGRKMGCDSVVAEAEETWLFPSSVF